MFETAISDAAAASWRRLPDGSQFQVMEALKRPLGKMKLEVLDGADATFSMAAGNFRVVFRETDNKREILTILTRHEYESMVAD